MNIDLERIDMLRERAEVSYKDARAALEACDGDILEALIWLEENGNVAEDKQEKDRHAQRDHYRKSHADFGRRVESGVKELHRMRFKILKDREILLNLPATVALLVGVITVPISLIVLLAAVLLRYQVIIEKPEDRVHDTPDAETAPENEAPSQEESSDSEDK